MSNSFKEPTKFLNKKQEMKTTSKTIKPFLHELKKNLLNMECRVLQAILHLKEILKIFCTQSVRTNNKEFLKNTDKTTFCFS